MNNKCQQLLENELHILKGKQLNIVTTYVNNIRIKFSNGTEFSSNSYRYRINGQKTLETKEAIGYLKESLNCNSVPNPNGESDDEFSFSEELLSSLGDCKDNLFVSEVKCIELNKLIISFKNIDNFFIELYSSKTLPTYTIHIETEKYELKLTTSKCAVLREKVAKDYKSFSSAAKPRFRAMANDLGYKQITGIVYVKERDGWYETFNLQLSQGNSFFYLNYGVIVPSIFPASREELRDSGWNLGNRLSPEGSGAFSAGNKKQMEESAAQALELYKKEVVPWFESLTLDKIKKKIEEYGSEV